MAGASDIVCLGLGSWSSINRLPTLGFGVAAAVVVVTGPWRVAAAQVYVAGAQKGQGFMAGQQAGDVFVAGADEGEGSG